MQLITSAAAGAAEYPEKTLTIDGTESLVAIELCKKLNCTLALVPGELRVIACIAGITNSQQCGGIWISPDDGGQWGEIYDNYTGNGILGSVVMKESEIGFGAIYMWSVWSTLSLSLSVPFTLFLALSCSLGTTSTHSLITQRRCPDPELRASCPIRSTYRLSSIFL